MCITLFCSAQLIGQEWSEEQKFAQVKDLPEADPADVGMLPERLQRVDSLLKEAMAGGELAGQNLPEIGNPDTSN